MSKLLIIDDDPIIRRAVKAAFEQADVDVQAAANAQDGLALVSQEKPDVVLLDVVLPDSSGLAAFQEIHKLDVKLPVVFITAGDASGTAIEAMKLGAYDYLVKPLDFNQLRTLVAKAIEMRRLMQVPVQVAEQSKHDDTTSEFLIGRCAAMQEVYKGIGRVAAQNITVLINGESGTGKELVARAIYHHSERAQMPFLAVNCAAISETLLDSELFGHEKGAFTGAETRRIGKFEQCSGGTIFLDEIGDMTPLTQSKMLRLLQQQEFQRVGGNETIKTDVRIIAATNRDLKDMVSKNEFRSDLYYRLSVFEVLLPPLKDRGEDFDMLVDYFTHRYSLELGKDFERITPGVIDALKKHSWPGNIRELQSVVKQTLLRATGPVIVPDFLPASIGEQEPERATPGADSGTSPQLSQFIDQQLKSNAESLHADTISLVEKYLLNRVLTHTGGNQLQAAKILGITRGSLRNKIRALGISIDTVIQSNDAE